jgi:N-acyl-L-homoserine lactone synthetase
MSPVASSSPAEDDRTGDGIARLDALAARLIATAAPRRLAVAASLADREPVHRLRYDQVITAGWAGPDDLPGNAERDDYDDDATHVTAHHGTRLVGALRLVFPNPGRRLPVEKDFDLVVEPAGHVVEAGRLVVARDHRGDAAHRIWGALFGRAWQEVRARGYAVLAGTAVETMVARYHSLGLPFEVLGPPREVWGEWRLPVRMDPAGANRAGWFHPT